MDGLRFNPGAWDQHHGVASGNNFNQDQVAPSSGGFSFGLLQQNIEDQNSESFAVVNSVDLKQLSCEISAHPGLTGQRSENMLCLGCSRTLRCDRPDSRPILCSNCSHLFCATCFTKCVQRHLAVSGEIGRLTCPKPDCGNPLPLRSAFELTDAQMNFLIQRIQQKLDEYFEGS
eukprot:gnl/MRDRNA2_/MRDRNA2_28143_c0_seq1.p1 gnl/MRDRNA2_/MRDRNA2_28143_c0~~gnl/MRDRNA2_/MRDRNA2_28143_c0_seq1.p1  ORF type:complete len:174 (+),score=24.75 gnl/MRDRNA2_/MRDRNA2_28143_c0_seq1:74-595(+)